MITGIHLHRLLLLLFLTGCTTTNPPVTATASLPPATSSPSRPESKPPNKTIVPAGTKASPNCSIVFADERNGQSDLFTILSDGTQLMQLTNDAAREIWPAWSPDRTRIVFFSRGPESPVLYLMNADGSGLEVIPGTTGGASPDWSPDGASIVYRKELPGNDEIFIITSEGANPINLTNHRANDNAPDFSPDGKTIVFESIRDGNYELYLVDSNGENLRRLTDSSLDDQHARWSPDGRTILFTHHGELHLIDPDGSNLRPLGTDPISGIFADWGPCEE